MIYFKLKLKCRIVTFCHKTKLETTSRNTARDTNTNTPSQGETSGYQPRMRCRRRVNFGEASSLVKMSASCMSVDIHLM
jgi:hypothetical protein